MTRCLTVLLALYWSAAFALSAWDAARPLAALSAAGWTTGAGMGPAPAGALVLASALVLSSALVSVLFLWTLATCLWERGGEETAAVARLACAAAVAAEAAAVMLSSWPALPQAASVVDGTMLLAVLLTYLVMRLENREGRAEDALGRPPPSPQVARLSALDAAHGSLLGRIAAPRPMVATHHERRG